MAGYRLYYLNSERRIFAFDQIEAESDAEALATARTMAPQRPHALAWELWHQSRCIHTEDKGGAGETVH
ncbi:MAG TPA: hypothetical protein VN668_00765 [Stellaceae bacterium]|nr:hypothetical protein [Stellaceae bacterium]